MLPKLIVSTFVGTFLGLGLLICAASGQQPTQPPLAEYGGSKSKGGSGAGAGSTKQTDPTDALVHAALAHDSDVKIAQAKLQLADAELAKAKQAIVFKVLTLNATIQELKTQVSRVEAEVGNNGQLAKANALDRATLQESRMKLESAKIALAKAEMEMRLLTGGMLKDGNANAAGTDGGRGMGMGINGGMMGMSGMGMNGMMGINGMGLSGMGMNGMGISGMMGMNGMMGINGMGLSGMMGGGMTVAKGPIPDRIRVALDKPVKLGAKGEQVTFAKALEVFKKDAGLDVPVRESAKVQPITSEGEVLPVGAWFQLFSDNNPNSVQVYVREYGLLVTSRDAAPPNAITVMELWKQPEKKDSKTEPVLRKYLVSAGTAESIAKTLQQNDPGLRIIALPTTNEILILATDAEHATFMSKFKDIGGGDKKSEPKSKTDPAKP